jgi:hypothetical protein
MDGKTALEVAELNEQVGLAEAFQQAGRQQRRTRALADSSLGLETE